MVELRPPTLASNVGANPLGWAVEISMASAFLTVIAMLDPTTPTLQSLLPIFKKTTQEFIADVLEVSCGIERSCMAVCL